MDYIDRIRAIRKKNGKSQADMALLLETTQQQYSRYEIRTNELPIRHLVTICQYFQVSADEILGLGEQGVKDSDSM